MKFEDFQHKYPNLFKEYPRSGFDVRPGWETLVDSLCGILEQSIAYLPPEVRSEYQCAQIKEKFGSLRFYMTAETDYMNGAISMAEEMSYHICETCGLPGETRPGGWILTLCDRCAETRKCK
jgi:hypothetical protein